MEYIKLPFGGSMVLKFFNPLFNDISSYSLPMSFNGKIPYVKKAFGYPDKIEAEVKTDIEGRIKTRFLDLIGSWEVIEASENNISAYFKPGSGDFSAAIKDKLLTDIDYGGVKWPVGQYGGWPTILSHLNTKMTTSYPDSEYAAFCAFMPNGVNEYVTDHPGFVNEVSVSDLGVMAFSNALGNTAVYLFAGTVIDYLFTSLGYKIEENIFRTDEDLKQLVIFNTFNLYPPLTSSHYNEARIDYKDLVPHISCGDFLKAIRNRFNIGFFVNEQQKSVRIKSFDSIIKNGVQFAACITWPKSPIIQNNRLKGITFPLNEPDAWSSHSYKEIDELSDAITVLKYRDILPSTREVGVMIFVKSESSYYRIVLNNDDPPINAAERIATDSFPYSEGDGSEEFPQMSGIPAMCTQTINHAYHFTWLGVTYDATTDADYVIPRCDLAGNGYGQPFTEFPLMFLFARGISYCNTIQPVENPNDNIQEYTNLAAFPSVGVDNIRYLAIDTGYFYRWYGQYIKLNMPEQGNPPNFSYPFGTNDVYGASGTKISAVNKALKWGGDYGLIKWLWTNRINWEMNIKKLIKCEMLSDDIVKLIDMSEWKEVGNDNVLVNSFEIALEEKGERLQNVELLRL